MFTKCFTHLAVNVVRRKICRLSRCRHLFYHCRVVGFREKISYQFKQQSTDKGQRKREFQNRERIRKVIKLSF